MISSKLTAPLAVSNTLIEWVEYAFFLYFSPTISQLFFPSTNPHNALLMTYGLFAISYLIRPISALILGHLSDRFGRKPILVTTIFFMALATLGIGLLPTYATLGAWAPVLLLILRMLQSISVSGEFQSTAIYLIEHAKAYPIFAGALIMAAASGGLFLGGAIASLLTEHQALWRLPFIVTGCLSLLLCLLRSQLTESPVFQTMQQEKSLSHNPSQALLQHRGTLWQVFLLSAFVCAFVYLCNGYFSHYLAQHASYSTSQARMLCSLTELVVCISAPLIALTLKPHSYKRIMSLGILGLSINAPIQFYAAYHNLHNLIITTLLSYSVFDSLMTATIAYALFAMTPKQLRCTSIGLGWNLAAALVGGTSPILAAHLVANGHPLAPGILVMLMGVTTLVVRKITKH